MKNRNTNTIAVVAVASMLSFAVASPAYATNKDKCANSFLGLAKQSCVEQVNLEDMRVKSGDVSGNTLTLRVEDQGKTKDRNYIYGRDVEIDVSGLNQADGVATNTTAISNVHNKVTNNTQNIAATNQRIDGVMNDMRYMDRNLSAGIASSIAIGQHQFDPSFKGGQVSLSGGFYNGQNAVSLAVGVPVGERAFFSASIASDSGSYGESGGVGVTIRLP